MLANFFSRQSAAALAVLWAVALPAQAFGYSIGVASPGSKTIVKWFSNNVTYYLHPACSPDLDNTKCKDQLRAGFLGWMAMTCTSLAFTEGYHCNTAQGKCLFDKGVACSKDADCPAANNLGVLPMGYNTNNRNEIVFIETSAWKFGQYVLGVTSPVTYNNGAIFEADIALNGYHYKWVADPGSIGSSLMDILSVAIHEEGHFFGVQHMLPGSYNDKDPPTMAPAVDPFGKSATLNADDGKAICFLNPKEATYKCASDADCPYVNEKDKASGKEFYSAKLTCGGGVCGWGNGTVPATGNGDLGAGCGGDTDCKTGLFCQPFGNKSYCSQTCSPQQKNCPASFTCYGYQNQPTKGACLPTQGGPTTPTKVPGEMCGSSGECKSLMCLSGICRVKCTPSNPTECTAGKETCAPIPSTGIGACVPDDKPKLKAVGENCNAPEECDSGLCLKDDVNANHGVCRQACKGKFSCPSGFACVPQTGGFEACLPGSDKLPAGSACTGPAECANGPCIAYANQQFCSQSCTAGQSGGCPCGMTCENSNAGYLCLPGKKVKCADVGNDCADTSECGDGLLCFAGKCASGCDVRTGAGCGPGQGCLRVEADTPQGTCQTPGAGQLGDPCDGDAKCQSLFCGPDVTHGGEKRCLKPCNPDEDSCGSGFACNAVTQYVGGCFLVGDLPKTTGADAGATAGSDASATGGADSGNGSTGTKTATVGTTSGGGLCSAGRVPRDGRAGMWALLLLLGGLAWRRRAA